MKSQVASIFLLLILLTGCQLDNAPSSIDLSKEWRFAPDENNIGVSESWFSVDFDDSKWDILQAGKKWEVQGYAELDGYGWYRKTVTIPADWKEKDTWIKLAYRRARLSGACDGFALAARHHRRHGSNICYPTW